MDYHSAVTWIEELYTYWYFNTSAQLSFTQSNGTILFDVAIKPYLNIMDIAFAEMMLMYWQKEGEHCWYGGWNSCTCSLMSISQLASARSEPTPTYLNLTT